MSNDYFIHENSTLRWRLIVAVRPVSIPFSRHRCDDPTWGSGCGAVGRVVASYTSSNSDIAEIISTNCTIVMTKIKKRRLGMAHLLK